MSFQCSEKLSYEVDNRVLIKGAVNDPFGHPIANVPINLYAIHFDNFDIQNIPLSIDYTDQNGYYELFTNGTNEIAYELIINDFYDVQSSTEKKRSI